MLQQPDHCATLIDALKGANGVNKDICPPLRYASVLIAKGFLCDSQEVGMIIGMHLRVVSSLFHPSSKCCLCNTCSVEDWLLREQIIMLLCRLMP